MSEQQEQEKFSIVFAGQLGDGAQFEAVKQKVAQLFKLSPEKADQLLRAKSVTLKKNLDDPAAKKYQKILNQIGMVVQIKAQAKSHEPSLEPSQEPSQKQTQKKPQDTFQHQPQNQAQSTAPPAESQRSLGEQFSLASQPARQKASHQSSTSIDSTPPSDTWQLDEPGVRLSKPKAETPAPIAEHDLSIAPQGDILNAAEKSPQVPPPKLSVLDDISLADVGDNLVDATEKNDRLDIDLSQFSIDDAGDFLLKEHERTVFVEKNIDTSAVSLMDEHPPSST